MSDIFQPINVTNDESVSFEALVGEDKRFKTSDDLAKAKIESDRFIDQLKRENDELRKEVTSKATLDEIMTKIREMNAPQGQQPPVTPPANPDNGSPQNIESVVATLLEKRSLEDRVRSNTEVVSQTLQEKFGADAQIHLNKKAKELGVSLDYLRRIASESPKAFFTLIGVSNERPVAAPVVAPRVLGQVHNEPVGSDGQRNKAYYDKIKAVNPAEYFSPKIQNQMYKDAMKLGDAFY